MTAEFTSPWSRAALRAAVDPRPALRAVLGQHVAPRTDVQSSLVAEIRSYEAFTSLVCCPRLLLEGPW